MTGFTWISSSGSSAIGNNKLKSSLGTTDGHNRVYDVVLDVVDLGRTFDLEDKDWYPVKLADEEGDKIARMPEGATFFGQTNFPYIDDYPDDYSNLDTAMFVSKGKYQQIFKLRGKSPA